ncbi:MAG: hypothetical protein ACOX4R_01585 [Lentihominibacter sp.]|jgi:hypothetical protein
MRKILLLVCSLLLFSIMLTGCKDTPEQEEVSSPFKPGVWIATGGEYGQFYFFNDDGTSGKTAVYVDGTGEEFTYEEGEDGKIIFHMKHSTVPLPCNVDIIDDTHIHMGWEAQYEETLEFLSPLDAEHFHFYTNDELCEWALQYYEALNDADASELMTDPADNGDGTVNIRIFADVNGYDSDMALYRIDRCTGEGEDINTGEPMDLTNGSPDIDIKLMDPESSAELPGYHECIVSDSSYSSDVLLTAEVPVKDFKVVSLEYKETDDDQFVFNVEKELFSVKTLVPEKPLVISTELPETIPNIGIEYSDRNGETKLYTISMSGLDGAPLLVDAGL